MRSLPLPSTGSRAITACIECRLAKTRCQPVAGLTECERCNRFELGCVTVSHRRGRRAKSRLLSGRTPSSIGPIAHPKRRYKTALSGREADSFDTAKAIDDSFLASAQPQGSNAHDETLQTGRDWADGFADDGLFDQRNPRASSLNLKNVSERRTDIETDELMQIWERRNEFQPHREQHQRLSDFLIFNESRKQPAQAENVSEWDFDKLSGSIISALARRRQQLRTLIFTVDHDAIDASSSPHGGEVCLETQPITLATMLDLFSPPPQPSNLPPHSNYGKSEMEDPVSTGILSLDLADRMFTFFMARLNVWACMLDKSLHTHQFVRSRSTFLYSVVLYMAAKLGTPSDFTKDPKSSTKDENLQCDAPRSPIVVKDNESLNFIRNKLQIFARDQAARTLVDGDRSVEAVQGFFFLSTWKEIDDSLAHIHSGFAFRLAMDLRLGDPCPLHITSSHEGDDHHDSQRTLAIQTHFRNRQRTLLLVFVQERIQSVLYVSSSAIPISQITIQTSDVWRTHKLSTLYDTYCCAAVEVRKIQSRYQNILDGVRIWSLSQNENIIISIKRDLDDWNTKWSAWFSQLHGSMHTEFEETLACWRASMLVWKHSIALHLGSKIQRQSLSAMSDIQQHDECNIRYSAGSNISGSGIFMHERDHTAAERHPTFFKLTPALEFSIGSARAVLAAILQVPAAHIRCMPDSLTLEMAHAVRFLVSMVCICDPRSLDANYLPNLMNIIGHVYDLMHMAAIDDHDTIMLHVKFLKSIIDVARKESKQILGEGILASHANFTPHMTPDARQMGHRQSDNDLERRCPDSRNFPSTWSKRRACAMEEQSASLLVRSDTINGCDGVSNEQRFEGELPMTGTETKQSDENFLEWDAQTLLSAISDDGFWFLPTQQ